MEVVYPLIITIIALAFSAFFSGIEIAFLSADKLLVMLEEEKKSFKRKFLLNFLKTPSYFISATLLGNTIALVIYSTYMAEVLFLLMQSYFPIFINYTIFVLIFQTVFTTLIVLIVAEFIPKTIFFFFFNRGMAFFVWPMLMITYVLHPLIMITIATAKFIMLRILKKEYIEDKSILGLTDLYFFIKHSSNANSATPIGMQAKIVNNIIEFKKMKIRDCMIPRTHIVAVSIHDDISFFKKAAMKSNHYKILVYGNDIDNIIGYCHSKNIFQNPKNIKEILTPITIVPETNLASQTMAQCIAKRQSLMVVVDEFGGTAGMVSIQDIIEKIFGEIKDEYDYDIENLVEQPIADNTYLLSARHQITYLNEKYGWGIPLGSDDTLGGFIITTIERIPSLNEVIHIPPFTFTITSIKDINIKTVKISLARNITGL